MYGCRKSQTRVQVRQAPVSYETMGFVASQHLQNQMQNTVETNETFDLTYGVFTESKFVKIGTFPALKIKTRLFRNAGKRIKFRYYSNGLPSIRILAKMFASHYELPEQIYLEYQQFTKTQKQKIGRWSKMMNHISITPGLLKFSMMNTIISQSFYQVLNWKKKHRIPKNVIVVFFDLIPFLIATKQTKGIVEAQYSQMGKRFYLRILQRNFGIFSVVCRLADENNFMWLDKHLENNAKVFAKRNAFNMPFELLPEQIEKRMNEQKELRETWKKQKLT